MGGHVNSASLQSNRNRVATPGVQAPQGTPYKARGAPGLCWIGVGHDAGVYHVCRDDGRHRAEKENMGGRMTLNLEA